MALTVGTRLGHYEIIAPLGAGGMGEVYRARDERLKRDVAIKVLPAEALSDDASRKQFRKEALALSSLNHPNIGTIHDFDSDGGMDFLVMELVPGQTLSDRIAEGPLGEEEIARLGEQLAVGLSVAHREGILHRDIKPSNLRITTDGRLKILDFGLAKFARPAGHLSTTETLPGGAGAAGTLPYMAPEQLRNLPPDPRSDIYSAGAVMYEMACGKRAFPQDSAPAVIGAILASPPVAPRLSGAPVSPDCERIILRCLEKDPMHRYQTADELAADLRQLALPARRRRIANPHVSRVPARVAVIGGAGLLAAAFLVLALNLGGLRGQMFGAGAARMHSLVVLPLVNLSGDPGQEYFVDGMTDELITRLAQVGALRVISRSSAVQYKGTKKPLRQIAKELGVDMVVEGSVVRSGDMVRISAQLVDALKDRHLWAESYERNLSNVLALQSDVARAIVAGVQVRVTSSESVRLAYAPAVDPMALQALLRGQTEMNRGTADGYEKARGFYREALTRDPGYAAAYAALANVYCLLSNLVLPSRDAMPQAKAAALMAIQLDSTSAPAHSALGYVTAFYEWDWARAEKELRRTLELSPGNADAHATLGYLLVVIARFQEASDEFRRAHELDPLSSYITAMTLYPLYEGRRYDEAIEASRRLLQASPDLWNVQMILAQSLLQKGAYQAGIAAMKEARRFDDNPYTLGWHGYALAIGGQSAEARKLLSEIQDRAKSGYVPLYPFVVLYTGLGERDRAIACLEQGVNDHSEDVIFLKVDPALDPLRADPRFAALLRRMGLAS